MRRPPQGMVALAAVGAPQEPLELEAARAGAGVLLAPPVAALRVLAGAAAEALVAAPVAVRGGAALKALVGVARGGAGRGARGGAGRGAGGRGGGRGGGRRG